MQSHGCRRGDRVGLMVSKSPLAIASILAVLKADCIYVPLDVDSPGQRIIKILENSEPRLLLVDESGTKTLQELWSDSTRIGFKAASLECRSALPDRNPYVFCGDDIVRFSDEPIDYQSAHDDPATSCTLPARRVYRREFQSLTRAYRVSSTGPRRISTSHPTIGSRRIHRSISTFPSLISSVPPPPGPNCIFLPF